MLRTLMFQSTASIFKQLKFNLIMDSAKRAGIGFGVTSGVITTLGLMTGLYFTTDSLIAVVGGIIIIAIADAMSDALGIHISTESQGKSDEIIWKSTIYTFFSKFIIASIFLIAFFLFSIKDAIIINIVIGLIIISIMSYKIAKRNKSKIGKTILEHLVISILVIIIATVVGHLVSTYFN
jgi:vacuolar iron transporter family protein